MAGPMLSGAILWLAANTSSRDSSPARCSNTANISSGVLGAGANLAGLEAGDREEAPEACRLLGQERKAL